MGLKKLKESYNKHNFDEIEHYLNTSIKIIDCFGVNTWAVTWKQAHLSYFIFICVSLLFISLTLAFAVVLLFNQNGDMFDVL